MTGQANSSRWILPTRLASDSWWLVGTERLRPSGTILAFIPGARPERGRGGSRSPQPEHSADRTV